MRIGNTLLVFWLCIGVAAAAQWPSPSYGGDIAFEGGAMAERRRKFDPD